MRVRTSGALRRIDLTPALGLVPAVLREWANLEFDGSGQVVNPLSRAGVEALVLVDGVHRHAGSRYQINIDTPRIGLPQERQAEFDEEQARLARSETSPADWHDHFERRRRAGVQVGVDRTTLLVTLVRDDPRHLAATVSDDAGRWAVDVDVTHGRLPRVDVTARVDLTALLKDAATPGCLARMFGGEGVGRATIDLTSLERGADTLLDASGSANRFRGSARLRVDASASRWKVRGVMAVRARGFGRILLLVAGRRFRRQLAAQVRQFWRTADHQVTDVESGLQELRASVAREGGPDAFVRRALWDPAFDPTPPSARR